MPSAERLAAKIEILDNGCWEWTGKITPDGYGACGYKGRRHVLAHRAVFEEFVGPIPEGMVSDHVCHTDMVPNCPPETCKHRRCVNPDHVEFVTNAENIRRGHNTRRTAYIHGHEYTEANTYRTGGRRYCIACHTARYGYPQVSA
jgi:hypothetical protein